MSEILFSAKNDNEYDYEKWIMNYTKKKIVVVFKKLASNNFLCLKHTSLVLLSKSIKLLIISKKKNWYEYE